MDPKNVDEIIKDFKGRRAGILKALTKDAEKLYKQCKPPKQNNPTNSLCLFGLPNKTWALNIIPSPHCNLPVPKPGINLVRDSMPRATWFSMVGFHSHAWLHSLASYHAVVLNLNSIDNKRLFKKILGLPSINEAMQERNSRKRANLKCEELPKEIIIELLCRLPLLDVVRCRVVCKLWLDMIDDPCFVNSHLSKYKRNLDGSNLLVVEQPMNSSKRSKQVCVRQSNSFRKVLEIDCSSVSSLWEYMRVIDYINGVMLMMKGTSKISLTNIVLWNPSINVFVKIPNNFKCFFDLGFGFDDVRNDFKVIAVVYPSVGCSRRRYGDRFRGKESGRLEVYDLSTGTWSSKVGVECPIYWTSGSQLFFKGAIHWRNLGPKCVGESWTSIQVESHLIAFDVCREEFKYFELPNGANIKTERFVRMVPVVINESLAMFYAYGCRNDIWVMEEYGVEHSWCKRYSFSLQFDAFLQLKPNGEFMFALNGKGVKSYDIKGDRTKDLAKTYNQSSIYDVYTFVESFMLRKSVHKQPSESS